MLLKMSELSVAAAPLAALTEIYDEFGDFQNASEHSDQEQQTRHQDVASDSIDSRLNGNNLNEDNLYHHNSTNSIRMNGISTQTNTIATNTDNNETSTTTLAASNDVGGDTFNDMSLFSESLEDLVNSFDEKITNCFQDYDEEVDKLAPVQVRSQDEILNDSQLVFKSINFTLS